MMAGRDVDRLVAALLVIGTYASVALLALGVLALAAAGISPLAPGSPPFDPARLPRDVAAARPEGFLWLGLATVLVTPAIRVVAALVLYAVRRERLMAGVSVGILAVVMLTVVVALGMEP